MAKATLMRLAGSPSIPAIAPVPRPLLAHNQRGASDLRDLRQAPRVPSSHSSPLIPISPSSLAPVYAPPLNLLHPPPVSLSPSDRLPSSP
jgi:hypothetical protein